MPSTISHYNLFYRAATETAIYAELWNRSRSGNHEASAPPTLRELLFPPVFTEPDSPPPLYASSQDSTTDVDLGTLPFTNTPLVVETTQRTPLEQSHPGPEWIFNHAKTTRAYPLMIRHDGNLVRARYVRYYRQQQYPKIAGTMGRGKMVFETLLRAHDVNKNLPRLTPPQIRVFDDDTFGRTAVDRALATMDDWPVTAEVQQYRSFVAELEEQHNRVARLRLAISETMTRIKDSVWRLSQNNVYNRVQTIIQREDDHTLWVSNADLRVQMQAAQELPASAVTVYGDGGTCQWCQTTAHASTHCLTFTQCQFCLKFGHRDEDCYRPHQNCRLDCLVPRGHIGYSRPCRLRPLPEETSVDEDFRRTRRRNDRIQRRADRRAGL
ncbi:hypothetical protein EDB84DRAFT_1438927 [Lactarius hengduanensis]|nr:hypothetical protein EDB84DRAFT_1438927 [Lactarius hengduanensis]